MKQHELKNYNLKCSFCRNSLLNQNQNVQPYSGDFVSVMCDTCAQRYKEYKQLGPKYVQCLCGDSPRELEIEMAKSEIKQGFTAYPDPDSINKLNIDNDKKILEVAFEGNKGLIINDEPKAKPKKGKLRNL